jgi:endonuclease/exonuclease/phosphatase family metal-dependent hydrolase
MVAAGLFTAASAHAFRLMTYNVLNYSAGREEHFRLVLQETDPDLLVVQEVLSQGGVDDFLQDVLDVVSPGEWAAGDFVNGPDTDNALYYKPDEIDYIGHYVISTTLRDIDEWTVRPAGSVSDEMNLRVYSLHLKASQGSDNEQRRLQEVTAMRARMETFPPGENYVIAGDFNIYKSSEPAYQFMLDIDEGASGVVQDPIDTPGTWHDNVAYALVHTQSPRTDQFGGGANGGLDDRFDLILVGPALEDEAGMDILVETYTAFGQDGLHFNKAIIDDPPNEVVSPEVAAAIHYASDHLPVFADFFVYDASDAPTHETLALGLSRAYPNPFRASTEIRFGVSAAEHVRLGVYDLSGRLVRRLLDGTMRPGEHTVVWDGRNHHGHQSGKGNYYLLLETPGAAESKSIILLR